MALARVNRDALDDVAQIAGRVPQGLVSLRLTDCVERPNHKRIVPRAGRRPSRVPLPERVTAEVRPELRAPPRDAAVVGDLDLAHAVAAVERDAFERHGSPRDNARAIGRRADERADRHAADRHGVLRSRARLDAATW